MVLRDIFILVLSILLTTPLFSQTTSKKVKKYNKVGKLKIDTSFQATYLRDFMVPFEQCEDLQNCRIKIKTKNLKTTMAARPHFFSLLLGKKNRRYTILINKNENFNGVLLRDVPSEARIGLFAHELMHIRDYNNMSLKRVVQFGYQYLSVTGKTQIEHRTDSLTIAAGFGQQLYEWAHYVLHDSDACEEYKSFKQEVYMSPVLIQTQMEQQQ